MRENTQSRSFVVYHCYSIAVSINGMMRMMFDLNIIFRENGNSVRLGYFNIKAFLFEKAVITKYCTCVCMHVSIHSHSICHH